MDDKLMRCAEALAFQRIVMENLGMANTPTDTKERINSDARYMIEQDRLRFLQTEYQSALRCADLSGEFKTTPRVVLPVSLNQTTGTQTAQNGNETGT